jgi:hypothetical protein
MSTLRPECETAPASAQAITPEMLFRRLHLALKKRRGLAFGQLNKSDGSACAMGCFWNENPGVVVDSSLIDAVAAVNDSVQLKAGSSRLRMKVVRNWVRARAKALGIQLS